MEGPASVAYQSSLRVENGQENQFMTDQMSQMFQ